MDLVPKVRIEEPLAAWREAAEGVFFCWADAGNTETSAPLSTRKERRKRRQKTERAPSLWFEAESEEMAGVVELPGVTDDPRRERFPRPLEELA